MRYPATIKRLIDGGWLARTVGSEVGTLEAVASGREAALELLQDEIRYRLEWCPCSAVADDYVELDITELSDAGWRGGVF